MMVQLKMGKTFITTVTSSCFTLHSDGGGRRWRWRSKMEVEEDEREVVGIKLIFLKKSENFGAN